ncbi:MAG: glycosyltransferase [Methanomassiliicoccales archaeon]
MNLLSVLLPTYNEAGNLAPLVGEIKKTVPDAEIIIIDDASPDGTGETADRLASEYENVRVIHRAQKLGLSSAVLVGAAVSEGQFVAVMDCDMQHPPQLLAAMLKTAQSGADVVIASRYTEGGGSSAGIFRRALSRGATVVTHLMMPETRKIMDPLSGYFLCRRELLLKVRVPSGSYKILLPLIASMGLNKRIMEIPFVFAKRYAGKSKFGVSETVRFLYLLLNLSNYRLFKFVAVGVAGAIVNELLLFLLVPHMELLLASAAAIEASIVSNFAMNNVWTFARRKSSSLFSRFAKYNGIALIGAVTNITLLAVLVLARLEYLAANFVGIVAGFAANYLGSEHMVWKL